MGFDEGDPAVAVDRDACRRLAGLIAGLDVPEAREEGATTGLAAADLGNFYLLLVAICHQTQSLRGAVDGRGLRGWDYLHARLARAVAADPALLGPSRWSATSEADVDAWFEDPQAGRTLSDPAGRAALTRDLGDAMRAGGFARLADLVEVASARIAAGTPNLLALLARSRAYSDPVRKKSLFLLGLLRDEAGLEFEDGENLLPPVDYHEVRGHLRVGTVRVLDPALAGKLLGRVPVSEAEDVAIRMAVRGAIVEVAGLLPGAPDPIRLHYLFWNVFRGVCDRQTPHCRDCPPPGMLSPRYAHLVGAIGTTCRCPFGIACTSVDLVGRFSEHVFDTDWY